MSHPPGGLPPEDREPRTRRTERHRLGGPAATRRCVRRPGRAIDGGMLGAPTVKVNGEAPVANETLTAEGLRDAVAAAGGENAEWR